MFFQHLQQLLYNHNPDIFLFYYLFSKVHLYLVHMFFHI